MSWQEVFFSSPLLTARGLQKIHIKRPPQKHFVAVSFLLSFSLSKNLQWQFSIVWFLTRIICIPGEKLRFDAPSKSMWYNSQHVRSTAEGDLAGIFFSTLVKMVILFQKAYFIFFTFCMYFHFLISQSNILNEKILWECPQSCSADTSLSTFPMTCTCSSPHWSGTCPYGEQPDIPSDEHAGKMGSELVFKIQQEQFPLKINYCWHLIQLQHAGRHQQLINWQFSKKRVLICCSS